MKIDHYRVAKETLDKLVESGEKNFILYPYGECGEMVKVMLNGIYGIKERLIIDNKLCDSENIYSLEILKQMDLKDSKILVTSDREEVYDEIRTALYEVADRVNCIEIFPEKLVKEQKMKLKQSLLAVKKAKETQLFENNMIYQLKKNSLFFFLPYYNSDLIQRSMFLTEDYFAAGQLHYIFNDWENGVIKEYVKGGEIIDAGANIGNHTLYFLKECEVLQVFSFEAVESTRLMLEKNISLNNMNEKTVIYGYGLSDENGNADAFVNLSNIGGTSLTLLPDGGAIQLRRLDDFTYHDIRFIKIDVEGMEIKVLKGGLQTIKKYMPYMLIESFGENKEKVKEILFDLGYQYKKLDDDYLFYPCSKEIRPNT